MVTLLLIDASTSTCRVGVANETGVLAERTVLDGFKHAEQLTLLIDACMRQSGQVYEKLAAVCITGGPGSYTGLRIGASVAKGICFAHQLPLIALNTLEVMAKGFTLSGILLSKDDAIVPMIDARRMEVFTAAFLGDGEAFLGPQAMVLDESSYHQLRNKKCHFFGDGALKFEGLFSGNGSFESQMYLGVESMRQLALGAFESRKFEDVAYYRPDYHKDFYSASTNK